MWKVVAVVGSNLRASHPQLVGFYFSIFRNQELCPIVVHIVHYVHRKAVGLARFKLVIVAPCGSVGIAGNPYLGASLWGCNTEIVYSCRYFYTFLAIYHHVLRCGRGVGTDRNGIFETVV